MSTLAIRAQVDGCGCQGNTAVKAAGIVVPRRAVPTVGTVRRC